jgi:tetratricopeptide (TPR) repeat protein
MCREDCARENFLRRVLAVIEPHRSESVSLHRTEYDLDVMRRPPSTRVSARIAMLLFVASACGESTAATAWEQALAKRGIDASLAPDPIAITPEVRAAADAIAGGTGGTVDQLKRIQDALFDRSRFTFDYDAGLTETAAEALAARRGNCVSFTNLFIAMARARGLRVKAGYLTRRVNGERRGDLVYVATHVVAVYPLHDRSVVFDFYRSREDPGPQIRLLDDFELAALYVNNRAVESLSAGDFAGAGTRLDVVLKLAPNFAPGYGNLGVLRRRQGDTAGALDAYRHALAIEPRDPAILGNLAALYLGIGREREAKAAMALADLSLATPYAILARGDLEAVDGKEEEALRFYKRAARLDPTIPDPQLAIARLALAAGRADDARAAALAALKLDPASREATSILGAVAAAEER